MTHSLCANVINSRQSVNGCLSKQFIPKKSCKHSSETTAGTPTTGETTSPELDSSTTVGNTITESAQTGSGCSAGCIAGVVLGAVALVTAISAIAAVVIIFITKK